MGLSDALSPTSSEVIRRYGLRPHPEGGHFREVYRSERSLGALPGYPGERSAITAIYFLLARGEFSAFHRIRGDEIWVHLAGAPLELVLLNKAPCAHRLAPAGRDGTPLVPVPSGVLQAARSLGDWTLVSCQVAPGFDFADFEMPSRQSLLRSYPDQADLVRRFTR
jgi:predicted cupin superfamily sugar epimerase